MKKTRSILKVQRFLRDRVFYHRLAFHKSLSNQIRLFKSSSIFLHKGIYDNIV